MIRVYQHARLDETEGIAHTYNPGQTLSASVHQGDTPTAVNYAEAGVACPDYAIRVV